MSNTKLEVYPSAAEPRVRQLVAVLLQWRAPEHEGGLVRWPLETARGPSPIAEAEQNPSAAQTVSREALRVAIRDSLAAWRLAERELREISPASPAWALVEARLARSRSSYQGFFKDYLDLDAGPDLSWFNRTRQTASALLPRLFAMDRELTTRR